MAREIIDVGDVDNFVKQIVARHEEIRLQSLVSYRIENRSMMTNAAVIQVEERINSLKFSIHAKHFANDNSI